MENAPWATFLVGSVLYCFETFIYSVMDSRGLIKIIHASIFKLCRKKTLGSSPRRCQWESGQVETISHMTEDEKRKELQRKLKEKENTAMKSQQIYNGSSSLYDHNGVSVWNSA
jgi:hypothetical protein